MNRKLLIPFELAKSKVVPIVRGVYDVPERFVVDKHGVIGNKHSGPVDAAAVNPRILPLVRQPQRAS